MSLPDVEAVLSTLRPTLQALDKDGQDFSVLIVGVGGRVREIHTKPHIKQIFKESGEATKSERRHQSEDDEKDRRFNR